MVNIPLAKEAGQSCTKTESVFEFVVARTCLKPTEVGFFYTCVD